MKIPTKKEAEAMVKRAEKEIKELEVLIKWAKKEILQYQNFIEDLKLFTRKKKITYKNV